MGVISRIFAFRNGAGVGRRALLDDDDTLLASVVDSALPAGAAQESGNLAAILSAMGKPSLGQVLFLGVPYGVLHAKVDLAASGELIAAPTDGTAIIVVGGHLVVSVETTVKFRYDGATDLTGPETWVKGGGVVWPYFGEYLKVPVVEKKLDVVLGTAAQLSGELGYIRVTLPD